MECMPLTRAVVSLLATASVVTSCGATQTSSPPQSKVASEASTSATSESPSRDTTFTSTRYGYAVRLPVGWTSAPATRSWDGRSGLSSDSSTVDQFSSSSAAGSWGVAAPWKGHLAAYADFLVAWNARYHGDTCPAQPKARSRITIGTRPGVLLSYDCGILINVAGVVDHGVGYWFGFRDPAVHAANDPADHAAFVQILKSVRFAS
jgi:hypothetical protein